MIEEAKELLPFAKVLLPFVTWLIWVDRSVRKNQQDIDRLYYEARGRQGMRCRSLKGRIRRALYGRKSR